MLCFDEKENTDIFTVDDLMLYLSIGRSTAYKLLRSGKIKVVKIGRLYRIPKKSVDEFVDFSRN